jgi:hypothetical protein
VSTFNEILITEIINPKKNNMKATEITIKRTSSYGRYTINGVVNGVEVTAITTDAEAFDYLNDEDYPEKQEQAIEHCETKLVDAFENL